MVGRRYARKEDNTIYLLNIMTEKECVQKKDEPKKAKEAKFIFMTADEPYDALVWAVSLRVSLRVCMIPRARGAREHVGKRRERLADCSSSPVRHADRRRARVPAQEPRRAKYFERTARERW